MPTPKQPETIADAAEVDEAAATPGEAAIPGEAQMRRRGGRPRKPADGVTAPPEWVPAEIHRISTVEMRKMMPEGLIEAGFRQHHLDYVKRRAEAEGRSVPDMLQKIVREAYAADPTKAGANRPQGTGRRGDFVPAAGTWR